jgi:hypothetical protein
MHPLLPEVSLHAAVDKWERQGRVDVSLSPFASKLIGDQINPTEVGDCKRIECRMWEGVCETNVRNDQRNKLPQLWKYCPGINAVSQNVIKQIQQLRTANKSLDLTKKFRS